MIQPRRREVAEKSISGATRAASVYLKNTVKERRRRIAALAVVVESIDNHRDEPLIPDSEKRQLRGQLMPADLSRKPDGQQPSRASSRDCLCYYMIRFSEAMGWACEGMARPTLIVLCFST